MYRTLRTCLLVALFFHSASIAPAQQQTPSTRVSGHLLAGGKPLADTEVDFQINATGPIDRFRTDANGLFSAEMSTPRAAITVPTGADQTRAVPIGTVVVLPGRSIDLGDINVDATAPGKEHLRVIGPIRLLEPRQSAEKNDQTVVALVVGCSGKAQNYCDQNQLTLVQANGGVMQPLGLKDQVGVSDPQIAEHGSAAGWLPSVPFCCTSYPISPHLVVYRPGDPVMIFSGDGRAIFKWKFVNNGEQVAFSQDFLHGTSVPHYELRDLVTGRLVDHWEGELTAQAPAWTRGL